MKKTTLLVERLTIEINSSSGAICSHEAPECEQIAAEDEFISIVNHPTRSAVFFKTLVFCRAICYDFVNNLETQGELFPDLE